MQSTFQLTVVAFVRSVGGRVSVLLAVDDAVGPLHDGAPVLLVEHVPGADPDALVIELADGMSGSAESAVRSVAAGLVVAVESSFDLAGAVDDARMIGETIEVAAPAAAFDVYDVAAPAAGVAELLRSAQRVWVLTGAGMSTESGLPDYRGPSGMWQQQRFHEIASIDALRDRPHEFWDFYRMRLDQLGAARPNIGHRALAQLQSAGFVDAIVTQNVDGLHQRAGSDPVIELHGSLDVARCRSCGTQMPITAARHRWAEAADALPRCDCGEVMGPGVVLFGEQLPPSIETAFELAASSDVVLVVGTSLEVYPAAGLPLATIERGGAMAIVCAGTTPFDDVAAIRVGDPAGAVLAAVARELVPRPEGA